MGSVPNVGLMAQAAEEYGCHDKTFEIAGGRHGARRRHAGRARAARARRSQPATSGGCARPRTSPIRDWVKLAVDPGPRDRRPGRVLARRGPRPRRQPDRQGRARTSPEHDTTACRSRSWRRSTATRSRWSASASGEDTISVTGNVLRDYLTDLFPIMELGTSAKMLSIVPLIERRRPVRDRRRRLGAQARAAAGQGELPALGQPGRVPRAGREPSSTWRRRPATRGRRSWPTRSTGPRRRSSTRTSRRPASVGEIDNRGSHFYLALYWAQELAAQSEDAELAAAFAPLAKALGEKEEDIVDELIGVQGAPADLGGYYRPDSQLADQVMRPSATFNAALEEAANRPPV